MTTKKDGGGEGRGERGEGERRGEPARKKENKESEKMLTKRFLTVVCLGATLACVACEKKNPNPTPAAGSNTGNAASDAIGNAANAIKKTAAQVHEEAVAAANNLYDSAREEFDGLADRISNSESPEKSTWQQLADGISARLDTAKEKLEAMRDENSDWKKLSAEFSDMMKDIGDSIKSLASKIK
jgi:hypothetical protein